VLFLLHNREETEDEDYLECEEDKRGKVLEENHTIAASCIGNL